MTAAVTIRNRTAQLTVIKTDENKDPLEGAHFALYRQVRDVHGNPRKDYEPISGYEDIISNGQGILSGIDLTLTPGTYYLTETEAAGGYVPLSDDICFTIGPDGMVTINSEKHRNWLTTSSADGVLSHVISIPNGPSHLTLKKEDDEGNGLKGAIFELCRKTSSWTSVDVGALGIEGGTDDGVIDMTDLESVTLNALPDGLYRLTETKAPAGYIITEGTIYFKMDNGAASLTDEQGTAADYENVSIDTQTMTITIANTPGKALPMTGGEGNGRFGLWGLVMCLIGGAELIGVGMRRRRRIIC
jgi:uncharacterized surface anchored protein